ncbi:MAG: hypothetical protein NC483_07855 [Ruminococcus sp.]|nr:hypothetical protein [Ruminococcus sp.]
MKKKKSNSKQGHNVHSDIVQEITELNSQVNTTVGRNVVNMVKPYTKSSNKLGSVIIISFIIVLIAILIVLIFVDSKKIVAQSPNNDPEKTILEKSYESLKFKEDTTMKKLTCSKKIPNDNAGIQEHETLIYYFAEDKVEIYIYHTDIVLTDEYIEYYDKIYNEYEKTLKNEYNYDNVDTDITRFDNEMLVTVITYKNKDGNKKLGIKPFLSYNDAKIATINDGYICE